MLALVIGGNVPSPLEPSRNSIRRVAGRVLSCVPFEIPLDSLLTAVWVNKIVPAFDHGTSKPLLVSCQLNI